MDGNQPEYARTHTITGQVAGRFLDVSGQPMVAIRTAAHGVVAVPASEVVPVDHMYMVMQARLDLERVARAMLDGWGLSADDAQAAWDGALAHVRARLHAPV